MLGGDCPAGVAQLQLLWYGGAALVVIQGRSSEARRRAGMRVLVVVVVVVHTDRVPPYARAALDFGGDFMMRPIDVRPKVADC